jgi:L-aminopeptidase/D-esterase-like protein
MPHVTAGPENLITDVPGIAVGHAGSLAVRSGVTVILPDRRVTAACDVRGGAPGTRETDAINAMGIVDAVDAVVLAGGSVYGLDAGGGATAWLGARGRGFRPARAPATTRVSPIVPAAVLYDLANGGDKDWGEQPPYAEWGRLACEQATTHFPLGNVGAGIGAKVGILKGGLGSASACSGDLVIGALVAVNAFGSAVVPGTGALWAAPFEIGAEFGVDVDRGDWRGVSAADPFAGTMAAAGDVEQGGNTTIGVIAVNAEISAVEARRIAIMAHDGLARAIRPMHSHVDGDVLFVLATGEHRLGAQDRLRALMRIGAIAADCITRAVGRGVCAAADLGDRPSYRSWSRR